FPGTSASGMNFWADLVFVPGSASPSVSLGSSPASPGSALVALAPSNSDAGASSQSATSQPSPAAVQRAAAVTWPYRGTVSQALALASSWRRSWAFGRFEV